MSPSLPSLLGLPSFDTTLGAVLLGLVVGIMLYGITVYQAYKYYTVYTDDGIRLKLYITVVLLFETFHSALWTIVCYHYLVTDAFDLLGLIYAEWSLKLTILITGITVFISQAYVTATKLGHVASSPNIFTVDIPSLPSTASTCTACTTSDTATIDGSQFRCVNGDKPGICDRYFPAPTQYFTDFKPTNWLISVGYGFAVASDVMLTGALVFVLHRSRTGSKRRAKSRAIVEDPSLRPPGAVVGTILVFELVTYATRLL
ncbi:hypothetical protein VTO73DRAFT_7633 [Trametes versicolor]